MMRSGGLDSRLRGNDETKRSVMRSHGLDSRLRGNHGT